jgi:hypothetical protein
VLQRRTKRSWMGRLVEAGFSNMLSAPYVLVIRVCAFYISPKLQASGFKFRGLQLVACSLRLVAG